MPEVTTMYIHLFDNYTHEEGRIAFTLTVGCKEDGSDALHGHGYKPRRTIPITIPKKTIEALRITDENARVLTAFVETALDQLNETIGQKQPGHETKYGYGG